MYVVAITHWARPVEQELTALAPLLGMVAYDLKLRIAGPLPVVFAREPDSARARELLAALRHRGHGAIVCDLAFVHSSAQMASPRSYVFEEDGFVVSDPVWGEKTMAYGEMLALVRATTEVTADTKTVDQSKKFSLGRAAISGGLMMTKTKTTERRHSVEQREQVLYLIRRSGRDPMILCELRLRHQGLGAQVKPTSGENFSTLCEMLRERAPDALYDERMLKQRRKVSMMSQSGTSAQMVAMTSNASDNDLAAHLIAVAHLQARPACG